MSNHSEGMAVTLSTAAVHHIFYSASFCVSSDPEEVLDPPSFDDVDVNINVLLLNLCAELWSPQVASLMFDERPVRFNRADLWSQIGPGNARPALSAGGPCGAVSANFLHVQSHASYKLALPFQRFKTV